MPLGRQRREEVVIQSEFVTMPDGTAIWCHAEGEGPVLVLCNGYVCTTQYWPRFVEEFSQHFTVVQWDYRSHGYSGVPEDRRTQRIPQYAQDLALVMDHLGIPSAVVVGHSMGVQVMLEFTARFPARVRGLVGLCGTYKSPFAAISDARALHRAIDAVAVGALRIEPAFWPVMKRLLRTELAISVSFRVGANRDLCPREYLEQLFAHVTAMDGRATIEAFRGMTGYSAAELLPTIRVPTLIVAGGMDGAATPALSRQMSQQIQGAELEIYPDCSHLAMIERTAEVHGRIRRFLDDHGLALVPAPGA